MAKVAETVSAMKSWLSGKGYTVVEPVPTAIYVNGPCCGLIALMNAIDACHRRDHGGTPSPLLIRRRSQPGGTKATYTGTTLYKRAKEKGASAIGELFSATETADLAKEYGLPATAVKVTAGDMEKVLTDAIGRGRTVMVPYMCNDDGDPYVGATMPEVDAHWALVFAVKKGKVLSTHWGAYFEWDVAELDKSNQAINPWTEACWKKGAKGGGEWDASDMARVNDKGYRKVAGIARDRTLAGHVVTL